MYSQEEKKAIKREYWEIFNELSAKRRAKARRKPKWLLDHTGIKQLRLKFHFDETHAIVGIDVDTTDLDKRVDLFDKLEKLKTLLEKAMGQEMIWDLEHEIENGKMISRVYCRLNNVNIYDKDCWGDVAEFMYLNMRRLEDFFIEYRDYLKY